MAKQKVFFFQDKMKAIYRTEIFASIIKHTIIHVKKEKGMNVVFSSSHECICNKL